MSPDDCKKDFCFLLNAASGIEGSFKIKFLTSHPKDFNDKLIDTVCGNDKITKEIHLPVQSGSDKILAMMNRGYTNADYLKLVRKLKNGHPDISISTDIIVGFPGETEEDFEDTLKLIEEAEFSSIFAFKYSPRPFTKASKFNDDILLEVKKERLEKVFQKYKEISLRHCGRWIAQP
jgi:2-methylthioadenine synthetase